jgi:hypothetical protein
MNENDLLQVFMKRPMFCENHVVNSSVHPVIVQNVFVHFTNLRCIKLVGNIFTNDCWSAVFTLAHQLLSLQPTRATKKIELYSTIQRSPAWIHTVFNKQRFIKLPFSELNFRRKSQGVSYNF